MTSSDEMSKLNVNLQAVLTFLKDPALREWACEEVKALLCNSSVLWDAEISLHMLNLVKYIVSRSEVFTLERAFKVIDLSVSNVPFTGYQKNSILEQASSLYGTTGSSFRLFPNLRDLNFCRGTYQRLVYLLSKDRTINDTTSQVFHAIGLIAARPDIFSDKEFFTVAALFASNAAATDVQKTRIGIWKKERLRWSSKTKLHHQIGVHLDGQEKKVHGSSSSYRSPDHQNHHTLSASSTTACQPLLVHVQDPPCCQEPYVKLTLQLFADNIPKSSSQELYFAIRRLANQPEVTDIQFFHIADLAVCNNVFSEKQKNQIRKWRGVRWKEGRSVKMVDKEPDEVISNDRAINVQESKEKSQCQALVQKLEPPACSDCSYTHQETSSSLPNCVNSIESFTHEAEDDLSIFSQDLNQKDTLADGNSIGGGVKAREYVKVNADSCSDRNDQACNKVVKDFSVCGEGRFPEGNHFSGNAVDGGVKVTEYVEVSAAGSCSDQESSKLEKASSVCIEGISQKGNVSDGVSIVGGMKVTDSVEMNAGSRSDQASDEVEKESSVWREDRTQEDYLPNGNTVGTGQKGKEYLLSCSCGDPYSCGMLSNQASTSNECACVGVGEGKSLRSPSDYYAQPELLEIGGVAENVSMSVGSRSKENNLAFVMSEGGLAQLLSQLQDPLYRQGAYIRLVDFLGYLLELDDREGLKDLTFKPMFQGITYVASETKIFTFKQFVKIAALVLSSKHFSKDEMAEVVKWLHHRSLREEGIDRVDKVTFDGDENAEGLEDVIEEDQGACVEPAGGGSLRRPCNYTKFELLEIRKVTFRSWLSDLFIANLSQSFTLRDWAVLSDAFTDKMKRELLAWISGEGRYQEGNVSRGNSISGEEKPIENVEDKGGICHKQARRTELVEVTAGSCSKDNDLVFVMSKPGPTQLLSQLRDPLCRLGAYVRLVEMLDDLLRLDDRKELPVLKLKPMFQAITYVASETKAFTCKQFCTVAALVLASKNFFKKEKEEVLKWLQHRPQREKGTEGAEKVIIDGEVNVEEFKDVSGKGQNACIGPLGVGSLRRSYNYTNSELLEIQSRTFGSWLSDLFTAARSPGFTNADWASLSDVLTDKARRELLDWRSREDRSPKGNPSSGNSIGGGEKLPKYEEANGDTCNKNNDLAFLMTRRGSAQLLIRLKDPLCRHGAYTKLVELLGDLLELNDEEVKRISRGAREPACEAITYVACKTKIFTCKEFSTVVALVLPSKSFSQKKKAEVRGWLHFRLESEDGSNGVEKVTIDGNVNVEELEDVIEKGQGACIGSVEVGSQRKSCNYTTSELLEIKNLIFGNRLSDLFIADRSRCLTMEDWAVLSDAFTDKAKKEFLDWRSKEGRFQQGSASSGNSISEGEKQTAHVKVNGGIFRELEKRTEPVEVVAGSCTEQQSLAHIIEMNAGIRSTSEQGKVTELVEVNTGSFSQHERPAQIVEMNGGSYDSKEQGTLTKLVEVNPSNRNDQGRPTEIIEVNGRACWVQEEVSDLVEVKARSCIERSDQGSSSSRPESDRVLCQLKKPLCRQAAFIRLVELLGGTIDRQPSKTELFQAIHFVASKSNVFTDAQFFTIAELAVSNKVFTEKQKKHFLKWMEDRSQGEAGTDRVENDMSDAEVKLGGLKQVMEKIAGFTTAMVLCCSRRHFDN